jgi:histidyl-tRNA synthetase
MTTETSDSLTAEIAQATGTLNELRLQNADASSIDAAKKRLGELRKTMAAMNSAGGSKDAGKKKKERLLLKTAKVCSSVHRDHTPLKGAQVGCIGHA